MAGTSADKLALLKATKADLKAALTEKGQTPGIVFSEYPQMVRAIDTQEDLDAEIATQDSLIAQIASALEGKTAGGGASVEPAIGTIVGTRKEVGPDEYDYSWDLSIIPDIDSKQLIILVNTATVTQHYSLFCVVLINSNMASIPLCYVGTAFANDMGATWLSNIVSVKSATLSQLCDYTKTTYYAL